MLISLIVLTLLVFCNAINHPFVHDDIVFIVQNPHIARLDHLWDAFLYSSTASNNGINAYYRPILEIVYRLEYALFGFNAAGYHLFNILIHLANGLLLFAIFLRLKFSRWMAYGISLLFLIHPIQTEAVACVSGISNLLSTLFVLLTVYAYLREKYWLAVLSFVTALLTKEQVIIVPLLLILIDWYQQKKNRYFWWILFVVITGAFLWLRGAVTGSHMLQDIFQFSGELRLRILAIPRTLMMYLRLLVLPHDLHYYRNTDILASNIGGFLSLTGLIVAFVYGIKKFQQYSRELIFGALWFLICLLPVLNIVPLINEYSFILTAEHFLYLPMVGIMLVIGMIGKGIVTKNVQLKLFCLMAFVLGVLSFYQNMFWKSEVALFERMVRYEPNFARGQVLLGKAYSLKGDQGAAIEHLNRALVIMKGYRQKSANAQATAFYDGFIKGINGDIAQCFQAESKWDQALVYYQEALRIDPKDVSILNNMAVCYLQQGDKSQAEQYFKMVLGMDPFYSPARNNLNQLLMDSNPS